MNVVDKDNNMNRNDIVHSNKVRAGKRRTYFFDVRQTKGNDFYLTLTESTRRFNGNGYERHKIFLYKEDFNRFIKSLEETIAYVKEELMPDYDYEEFDKRQEEWEASQNEASQNEQQDFEKIENDTNISSEEDMTW